MEGREKWRGNESNLHDKKVEHLKKNDNPMYAILRQSHTSYGQNDFSTVGDLIDSPTIAYFCHISITHN